MLKRLAQAELAIAAALLVAIVVLVFAAAIMRFFGRPLIWSVDLAQLLFIWLCFFGANRALRLKAHLGIDLIVARLPHALRLRLEFIVSAIIIVFLAWLAVEGVRLALQNIERQFGDSGLSYAWVTIAVPVGCVILIGTLGWNMLRAWREREAGQFVYSRGANQLNGEHD